MATSTMRPFSLVVKSEERREVFYTVLYGYRWAPLRFENL